MIDGPTRRKLPPNPDRFVDDESAVQSKAPKQPTKQRQAADRFAMLNAFVDATMRDLTPSEKLVWFVLWRDLRNGIATTAQRDIAARSGLRQATVCDAIKRLKKRRLLKTIKQGGYQRGTSRYVIRGHKN